MKIQVLPIGSVWFGKSEIAVCPWGGNQAKTYYTLADVRQVARNLGFPKFAGTVETERFGKEMFQKERRRKNAPISRLLCFKHRSRFRRSESSCTLARSEILHIPTLHMNPHPWSGGVSPGIHASMTSHLSWGEESVIKYGGRIYISPYELVVFSK